MGLREVYHAKRKARLREWAARLRLLKAKT